MYLWFTVKYILTVYLACLNSFSFKRLNVKRCFANNFWNNLRGLETLSNLKKDSIVCYSESTYKLPLTHSITHCHRCLGTSLIILIPIKHYTLIKYLALKASRSPTKAELVRERAVHPPHPLSFLKKRWKRSFPEQISNSSTRLTTGVSSNRCWWGVWPQVHISWAS